MPRLTLTRFLLLVLACAVGLVHAEPKKALPAIPAEAIQAVRAAQHGRDDILAGSLDRRLRETRALTERAARTADTQGAQDEGELASRRTEAAAKRSATEALELWRQLVSRFDALDGDLGALEKADRHTIGPRSRQAAQRIESWLAARPVAPLAPPNWQYDTTPLKTVTYTNESPQSSPAPRFVGDTLWLLRHHYASAGASLQVALRNTPPEADACGYLPPDLDATPEAPKNHPDIQALAKALDYNPARIFGWVQQKIAYEPYFGSLKGGVSTLWAKSGGATDQASLLIALLRAAKVPARYVRGIVGVFDTVASDNADGRGPRWIGAKNYSGALQAM